MGVNDNFILVGFLEAIIVLAAIFVVPTGNDLLDDIRKSPRNVGLTLIMGFCLFIIGEKYHSFHVGVSGAIIVIAAYLILLSIFSFKKEKNY